MESLGVKIRKLREGKKLPLRVIADFLKIDQTLLSKIERGLRNPTRNQVQSLAGYFAIEQNDLILIWLSDKLLNEVQDEELALEALQVAEETVAYRSFQKIDRKALLQEIIERIKSFSMIEKAWVYGSFARGDDEPKSDIDIALETSLDFSYFDLAEVQYQLEQQTNRKIDVGFLDSFKPYIFEHIKPDLKLIYEKGAGNNLA